ncbi:MAG: tyrosine phosphatase family protein [Beijerinckiaceae bacterium]
MPFIQVCSLAKLGRITADINASHVLTLINERTAVERPASILPDNHLYIGVSDIIEPLDGHIIPGEAHVQKLLHFVQRWDRAQPMIIHCYAGVSRSTAGALITACALNPDRSEHEVASLIRQRSPTATPNLRLVAVADHMLNRNGALLKAAEQIGRGEDCFEGTPFRLEI